ncbi:alpha-mannosidase [Clostridium sp. YIM B02515]|uniref:Alpha-mannosidase n=1 Tax=Clostridium rhizosphaerae TaxID=2803861 RepID=A0ABS1T9Y6_9CLOT|nr:glycoside hydrolase family 38 C-terminal domain-containing protein [Clostridium rhizosphaerae]MBL4936164.1 alpha-mannosidase [Clostridium rhizosphaerae]
MLVDKKIIAKLESIENRYSKLRYETVAEVPAQMWSTYEHFTKEPTSQEGAVWRAGEIGTKWGNNWQTTWFRGEVTLPQVCAGKKVFIQAKTNGDSLFIVDGKYKGVFDVNHSSVMMTAGGEAGKTYRLAFESYTGHHIPGCGADENDKAPEPDCKTFEGIFVVLEREDVSNFVFDLRVLRQLANVLDENSLRKNKIIRQLAKVYELVYAMPSEVPEENWRAKLSQARELMHPLLKDKNGSTMPSFGIVGHSHLDTAWLWPIAETWRKSARTFSSVLNLMDQYPELNFIQSTPYYASVLRERYPEIYEGIKDKVKDGRWEPNGAMWVEPDCNIPSGESFVRQLLVGQNATKEMFGYTSDTLWLPDVFGYSAALPQILRGSNVKYFCTTKLSWNDTNRFPYDTFVWKGIDGSSVISHFNTIHCWPDPETLTKQWMDVQHKDIQDRRLTAIGYGDGGGGPMAEMVEVSRRVKDLEGCPKAEFSSVSNFMQGIENELKDLPQWCGELYLELHRGTLTSIAEVKRGNRKTEIAYRNAEFLSTLAAINGASYPKEKLLNMWKKLLTNQFHDILPGSSIARVNDEAIVAFKECLEEAGQVTDKAIEAFVKSSSDSKYIMAVNSLSWNKTRQFILDNADFGYIPDVDYVQSQWIKDIDNNDKLVVSGLNVDALGYKVVPMIKKDCINKSAFSVDENIVETPFAVVTFDSIGRISSFKDKATGREIVKAGGALNTFWLGEDIPSYWDNWDIDRDQRLKMEVQKGFTGREIVSDGALELRLRSSYRIGEGSSIIQDMVLHADSPQVDFETKIVWSEKHRLLKAGFELDVFAENAKHEIQYGYVERATHENLSQDRARFESCAHKWSDISEADFGVALLNDCKYGVSTHGSDIRLSLMKSGLRPDPRGDEGIHYVTYSLVPHNCGFSVDSVIKPAYELNVPVVCAKVDKRTEDFNGLLNIDASNIIVEAVKWAENGQGFVVRFYDAAKTGKNIRINFNVTVEEVVETNLLEEETKKCHIDGNSISMYVKPFEIKTILCKLCKEVKGLNDL